MPSKTENFAVPPADVLSDILQTIHLQGGEIVRSSGHPASHPAGDRMAHIVERGQVRLELPTDEPVHLNAGDMALVARGDAHLVRPDGDAGWMTGTFLVDHLVADPLLSVLPAAVVIRAGSEAAPWLPLALRLMLDELVNPQPGSRVMLSRLLDLLFIRALRAWAATGQQVNPGWLTAALDPAIGAALSAIHREPTRDWPVDELAGLSALSRSAFAARFTALLGQPPGAYVLRHRLDRAAHLLASTTESVGRVATCVGYTSEAAFSRAFTRVYGNSPRTWRRTATHK